MNEQALEAAARECERVRTEAMCGGPYGGWVSAMTMALQHFIKLQEEGRV